MSSFNDILQLSPKGLYCGEGGFYIDPWQPVDKAVITHAHADHARWGCRRYLCAADGKGVLQARLGSDVPIETLDYGEVKTVNGVALSLHPAGHIRGSAQVRIEKDGRVWVVSGDYKREPDPTCSPLEPLRCHVFISESTFGLPIFRWPDPERVMADINAWWQSNRDQGRTSILFAYALGKAQRIMAGLDTTIGPILTHGAVEKFNSCYRETGIPLPPTQYVSALDDKQILKGALVIAPPSADNPSWLRKFPDRARAFASGWMRIRGNRRRRSVDRGFVLSDHSDWDGLVETIAATAAEKIVVTHGYAAEMARWLNEGGCQAEVIPTVFRGEEDTAEGETES
ncbi:MAG: ligase-associated DNA damage response exonuclease [Desulfobacterales bacterium]